MQVTVHVFDEIRDRLGRKTLAIELDEPATVGSLLRTLAARIDPLFGELGHTEASTYAIHAILLNGRRLQLARDDDEPVGDGDILHLIPPITGGADAPGSPTIASGPPLSSEPGGRLEQPRTGCNSAAREDQ